MPQPSTRGIRLFISCAVLLLLAQWGLAQCTITGKVTDSVNAPLPYAAVGILNTKDSTVIRGVLSNDSGKFTFTNIKAGAYLFKVSVTGYADQFSQPVKADSGKTTIVPTIQMKGQGHNLNGVQVVANKPFMQREADKLVFNVENSIITTGKTVLEMLNDLPGVTADDNGNISVMHKSGVLILVDGRPLHMDVTNFLKSLDASQVEKVEVITNPSAKYEASGKAVINIILKRDKNLGLNGETNTSYTQAFYAEGHQSFNINYRTKKWNFFTDANVGLFQTFSTNNTTETFTQPSETFSETAPAAFWGKYIGGTAGIDFTPDKRQTYSISFDGFANTFNTLTSDNMLIYSPVLDSSTSTPSVRNGNIWQGVGNLSYKFKIDSTGRELSVNAEYGTSGRNDNQQNPFYYYDAQGNYMRPPNMAYSVQPYRQNIWQGQADYTQPLSKKIKLDMGLFAQQVHQDDNNMFYNDINGLVQNDTTRSNHFTFTENVYAGYLNYTQRLNDALDFQVGLRAEQTIDHGLQYVHDTAFNRNYLNLFPSGTFNWKVSEMHSLSFSYTRRIDRPDFDQLDPFIKVTDPYTYQTGNIALLPQLSDNYEIDYYLGQVLDVTLLHEYMTNCVAIVYQQNNTTHETYTIPVNLNTYSCYNINTILTVPITKWWRSTNNINLYRDDYYGTLNGVPFENINPSIFFRTLNTFTFKKGWSAEISFWYNYKNLDGMDIISPVSSLDAGISKRFFHDKLTIRVSTEDLLKGQYYTMTTLNQGINIVTSSYNYDQSFRIGIMWKFGKSQYHREQTEKTNPFGGGASGKK